MQDLDRDGNPAIINAIVGMGQGLGLNIIAEGVENTRQLDKLRQLKCNEMQGYLFGAPMSAVEATRLLAQQINNGLIKVAS